MRKTLFLGSTVFFLLSLVAIGPVQAQFYNSCGEFHKEGCVKAPDKRWKYNGQSRSAPLTKGEISEFNIVTYGGQDYRISFCVDSESETKVEFQIFEEKKVKIIKEVKDVSKEDELGPCNGCEGKGTDSYGDECWECGGTGQVPTGNTVDVVSTSSELAIEKQREVLYDNTQDGLAQELEFSMDGSKRLILAVKLPGQSSGGRLKAVDMTCVGVYIENMSTPVHGF